MLLLETVRPKFKALSPTSCLTLGKSFHFFNLQFLHLKNVGGKNNPHITGLLREFKRHIHEVAVKRFECLQRNCRHLTCGGRCPFIPLTTPSGSIIPLLKSLAVSFFKSFHISRSSSYPPYLPVPQKSTWTTPTGPSHEPLSLPLTKHLSHSFVSRFRRRDFWKHTALIW